MPRLPKRLGHAAEAPVTEHLEELRARLFVVVAALTAGTTVGYVVHVRVLHMLIRTLPPGHRHLITLGVAEPFTTSLKISFVVGLFLALPIVLWQMWAFFAPAFGPRVDRSITVLFLCAGALMVAGAAFGERVALPAALRFLMSFDGSVYDVQLRAGEFISFALLVLAACGVVFELPIAVLGLVRIGALTSAKLRRNRRVGYMIVCVIGVALPGVDPFTTIIETIPLAVLFEASIWLSVAFERRWRPVVALKTRTAA
ncbi:MAG TPA: twin-arginine translocase subunit TatC [Gaiellaceae bacterium]|nr:twin-arginine translocase subunit TatC [Gaiellaceae bacterium]